MSSTTIAIDENNPAGAACLENAVVSQGHQGPLQDRCRPDRCANSIIAAEHIPIWTAERHTLLTLIATPGLSTCRKAVLERELADVDTFLHRTTPLQGARMSLNHSTTHPASSDPGVSARTAKFLHDAMERLLAGRPQRSDGRLIKDNLWKEAGVSRATMNRATDIMSQWKDRVSACDSYTPREARKNDELATLRADLATRTRECTQLGHQLDASKRSQLMFIDRDDILNLYVVTTCACPPPRHLPPSTPGLSTWTDHSRRTIPSKPPALVQVQQFGSSTTHSAANAAR